MKPQAERLEIAINSIVDLLCKSAMLHRTLSDAKNVPPSRLNGEIDSANDQLRRWRAAIKSTRVAVNDLHTIMERATDQPSERWTVQMGVLLAQLIAPLVTIQKLRRPVDLEVSDVVEKLGTELKKLQHIRDNPDAEPELLQKEYAAISGIDEATVSRMVKKHGKRILTIINARRDGETLGKDRQKRKSKIANVANAKAKATKSKPKMWTCAVHKGMWDEGTVPKNGCCPCGKRLKISV